MYLCLVSFLLLNSTPLYKHTVVGLFQSSLDGHILSGTLVNTTVKDLFYTSDFVDVCCPFLSIQCRVAGACGKYMFYFIETDLPTCFQSGCITALYPRNLKSCVIQSAT